MDACVQKPLSEAQLRRLTDDLFQSDPPSEIAPVDDAPLLDPEAIRASYPMSHQAMVNVVGLFRESCTERVRQMVEALDHANPRSLAKAAHALRGSLGMFASSSTIKLAASLEERGKQDNLADARELLERLEAAILALQPMLDQLLRS